MPGEGYGGRSTRYPDVPSISRLDLGTAPCGPPTWAPRNPYPIVCISNKDGVRGNMSERCFEEGLMDLVRGVGIVLNEDGIGIDKRCNAASSDISLATSAITCSTGT